MCNRCLQARDYGKARAGISLVGTAGLARLDRAGRARSPNGIIGHVGPCLCRWSLNRRSGASWPDPSISGGRARINYSSQTINVSCGCWCVRSRSDGQCRQPRGGEISIPTGRNSVGIQTLVGPRVSTRLAVPEPVWACRETGSIRGRTA